MIWGHVCARAQGAGPLDTNLTPALAPRIQKYGCGRVSVRLRARGLRISACMCARALVYECVCACERMGAAQACAPVCVSVLEAIGREAMSGRTEFRAADGRMEGKGRGRGASEEGFMKVKSEIHIAGWTALIRQAPLQKPEVPSLNPEVPQPPEGSTKNPEVPQQEPQGPLQKPEISS